MAVELTAALSAEIAEHLRGTCKSAGDAAEEFGVTEDQVDAACEQHEVVLCETCDWWCEQSEMSEEDNKCCECAGEND